MRRRMRAHYTKRSCTVSPSLRSTPLPPPLSLSLFSVTISLALNAANQLASRELIDRHHTRHRDDGRRTTNTTISRGKLYAHRSGITWRIQQCADAPASSCARHADPRDD